MHRAELSGEPDLTVQELAPTPDLLAGWLDADAGGGRPTEQLTWFAAGAESFGARAQLRFIVVGDPAQPAAVAALVQRGPPLDRRLEFVGGRELWEPMDAVVADPAALPALAGRLAHSATPVSLHRLPRESLLVRSLESWRSRRSLIRVRPSDGTPYIRLDDRWREPEEQLGSRRRSDARRARRRAQAVGELEFEVCTPRAEEVNELLKRAYAVELAGWKGRSGSALGLDSTSGEFFLRYAAAAARQGILRLAFLHIGGRPAAMQIAVESGAGYHLFKIGYDEQFARCSPGTLLILHTLGWAAARGLRTYEFLGTAEPWTRQWTEHERACVSVRVYPAAPRGALALGRDATAALGARARRRRELTGAAQTAR